MRGCWQCLAAAGSDSSLDWAEAAHPHSPLTPFVDVTGTETERLRQRQRQRQTARQREEESRHFLSLLSRSGIGLSYLKEYVDEYDRFARPPYYFDIPEVTVAIEVATGHTGPTELNTVFVAGRILVSEISSDLMKLPGAQPSTHRLKPSQCQGKEMGQGQGQRQKRIQRWRK